MPIDNGNEQKLEVIRRETNFEVVTPEKLMKTWSELFGENRKIKREKFTIVGGELTVSDNTVLEKAKLTQINDEVFMTWKSGEEMSRLVITGKDFMTVQTQEGGEKSLILSHNSVDKITGKEKQTIRRLTSMIENENGGVELNKWETKNPKEIFEIFKEMVPKGSTILMEKLKLENGEYSQEGVPITLENFSYSLPEVNYFRFLGKDRNGDEKSGHVSEVKTVIARKDDGMSSITWMRESNTPGVEKMRRFTVVPKK